MTLTKTICQACYFHCGLDVTHDTRRIIRIEGMEEHPVNRGTLCPKGLAAQHLVTHPNRLTTPLLRTGSRGNGQWKEIGWDEALGILADRLGSARDDVGPESVVFHRGQAPGWVKTYNYVTRFMSAFASPNLVTHAHLCFAPRAVARREDVPS